MKGHFLYTTAGFLMLTSVVMKENAGCSHSGIKGHVYQEKGNRMPTTDQPLSPPGGIKTTLYIYELTNVSQVTKEGVSAFYKTVPTKLIKEVQTKEDGSFKTKLAPGTYSLFVKKGDLFYSNIFDDKNNIYPVEVKKGSITDIVFRVNYDAVY